MTSGVVDKAPDLGRLGVPPGTILGGKYRIERCVGEGAMGVVVAATHVGLDETVAIKFIHPAAPRHPSVHERFAREAKVSAKISSEHVARVLDVGSDERLGPYMVMEYVDGRSFEQILSTEGHFAPRVAVALALQVCAGLVAAHESGVIHRDVKPANLMLSRRGERDIVKLLDFGASKAELDGVVLGRNLAMSAESVMAIGTPIYMSPEQLQSSPEVDGRTDVWSLGAVLYELLTGQTAFLGESIAQSCAQVTLGELPRLPADFGPDRARLQAVIDGCLERDPSRRFQSAAELAAALAPLVSDSTIAGLVGPLKFLRNSRAGLAAFGQWCSRWVAGVGIRWQLAALATVLFAFVAWSIRGMESPLSPATVSPPTFSPPTVSAPTFSPPTFSAAAISAPEASAPGAASGSGSESRAEARVHGALSSSVSSLRSTSPAAEPAGALAKPSGPAQSPELATPRPAESENATAAAPSEIEATPPSVRSEEPSAAPQARRSRPSDKRSRPSARRRAAARQRARAKRHASARKAPRRSDQAGSSGAKPGEPTGGADVTSDSDERPRSTRKRMQLLKPRPRMELVTPPGRRSESANEEQ